MSWKSGPQRYGAVAIAIHWLTAGVILALLTTGFNAEDMADDAEKAAVLRIHVVLGLSVLAVTLLRLAWWGLADRRPADPPSMPRPQAMAARIVHGLFYVVILVMAASGIATIALSGAGTVLFGGSAAALPDFGEFAPRGLHGIGASLLLLLLAAHVGAALYHQFVRRDRLLARMGLGR